MPKADTSRSNEYYIDQRGRIVECRVRYGIGMNCVRCLYHTPIGQDNYCRKGEVPTEVVKCHGHTRYFIEVGDE